MAAQSCAFSTDANAEKETEFSRTGPIRLITTFETVAITDYTERATAISNRTGS